MHRLFPPRPLFPHIPHAGQRNVLEPPLTREQSRISKDKHLPRPTTTRTGMCGRASRGRRVDAQRQGGRIGRSVPVPEQDRHDTMHSRRRRRPRPGPGYPSQQTRSPEGPRGVLPSICQRRQGKQRPASRRHVRIRGCRQAPLLLRCTAALDCESIGKDASPGWSKRIDRERTPSRLV